MSIELTQIAEAIDHLITAPMSNWTILKGIPLGRLYAASRRQAAKPLTLAASELLASNVGQGDRVLLISGFIMRDYGLPETDGPIGAAVLARAVALGLGAVPIGVSEAAVLPCLEACFAAAGLIPASIESLASGRNRCAFVDFPVEPSAAQDAARRILDEFAPKAVIAVERPGAAGDGEYHGGGGFEISSFTAKTDALFAMAQERGIATIGIGDLGNELGLGVVAAEVRAHVPMGETIAARLAADVAVIANISNWGAYGVAACLAAMVGNDAIFHDGREEVRLIDACVQAGAIDPVGGQRRPWVDGTDANTNAAMVDLLRSVVVLSQREKVNIDGYRSSWKG
jgi:hypothetical protein